MDNSLLVPETYSLEENITYRTGPHGGCNRAYERQALQFVESEVLSVSYRELAYLNNSTCQETEALQSEISRKCTWSL